MLRYKLIVLEVISQTKVSNFDFWLLTTIAQQDVLVLYIAVNNVLTMDVFKPQCDLRENKEYLQLSKFVLSLCFQIFTQVLPSLILGYNVVIVVNHKVVLDFKHVITRLASKLSIDL